MLTDNVSQSIVFADLSSFRVEVNSFPDTKHCNVLKFSEITLWYFSNQIRRQVDTGFPCVNYRDHW